MPTAAKFTQLSQKAVIGNNRFQKTLQAANSNKFVS